MVNKNLVVVEEAAAHKGLVLLDKATIKAAQDNIRKSLVRLDQAIHQNAVQCLMHAEKHGDTSLFRRLLVDIVDAKSGYRRQGIIAWMREFSPMELNGDVITLTGTFNGLRKPFLIEAANATPFTELAGAKEYVLQRPVFRDTIVSQVSKAISAYEKAVENTLIENGQVVGPKDVSKPFYNGKHMDKMGEVFAKMAALVDEASSFVDTTQAEVQAREALEKAAALNKAA